MTLTPPEFTATPYLFAQSVDFPQVLALPARHSLPEGDLLTFRFSNGYGAAVMRGAGHPQESAFEFGVLDFTLPEPQLTCLTPVCSSLLQGLSYEQVAQLLPRAERLPLHPDLQHADLSLENEDF
ncbi:hypothetical protein [Deinococcus koreensis]|uniref:Uncharacterized protein n=1 Tax=Deinococcus koreensis TaxID=2054903 RepID=A0A2K3UZ23_9DEIO|nr:hypothetical protein [Deinococcus koreensis]PNY81789.1 hypothetical protein CVO96_10725 [Deinococcus koreensis]